MHDNSTRIAAPIEQNLFVSEPALPTDFGDDYILLERVGQGGSGVVFKAQQRSLNRSVAIKLPRGGKLLDAVERERFQEEAKIAASLAHAQVVPVLTIGTEQGVPFIVMPFVEGMSWDISLKQPGTGVPEIMRRFLSLCDVITTCHTRGVVHRDLKPSNILVDVHGLVRVLDFGIANLTRPSEPTATAEWVVTGTPGYMAPEQYFGQPSRLASPAADVYSLGMLLLVSLRTLAGARDGELPTCLRVSPDPDRLCAEIGSAWTLAPILAKCLQLEPNNRWPDAGALASALREWELVPGLCSRDDVVRRGLWSRKFWLITSSAVAAVLVLGGMYQSVKGRFGKAARPEQSKSATPERIPSTNQPLAKPHSLPRGFD